MCKIIDMSTTEFNALSYYAQLSYTAVKPFEKLCFCAFSIRNRNHDHSPIKFGLNFPEDIYSSLELVN
jgi:hypothetical protein